MGNSFTVTSDGFITSIGLYPRGDGGNVTTPMTFHEGAGFLGPEIGSGTATFTSQPTATLSAVTVEPPVAVDAGQTYSFSVSSQCPPIGSEDAFPVYCVNSNLYPGGTFYVSDSFGHRATPAADMSFRRG